MQTSQHCDQLQRPVGPTQGEDRGQALGQDSPTVPPPISSKGKKARKPRASKKEPERSKLGKGAARTEGRGAAIGGNAGPSGSTTETCPSGPSRQGTGLSFPPYPTQNRVWSAHGRNSAAASPSSSSSAPPISSSTSGATSSGSFPSPSGYGARQGYNSDGSKICYDISSFKFIPDDDRSVSILLQKIQGDKEQADPASNLKTLHNFPTVFSADVTGIPLDKAPGAQAQWDDARFISVPDFASLPPEEAAIHPITRRETIPFLLISRMAGIRGGRWDIPSQEISKDFINDSICKLFGQDDECADVYDRTGMWGRVTIIYLRSTSADLLDQFRRQLTLWHFLGLEFDTFSKDVVVAKPELYVLLKDSMKAFQTDMLPKILFSRNRDVLAGSLRVLATRRFGQDEKSKKGEAKNLWRQIDLKGDDQILRCLRSFPESTAFHLGVDKVQIRGGLRPPESSAPPLLPPRQKRHWEGLRCLDTATESESQHQLQQPQPSSTRGSFPKRGRADRRGRSGRNRGRGFFS